MLQLQRKKACCREEMKLYIKVAQICQVLSHKGKKFEKFQAFHIYNWKLTALRHLYTLCFVEI